MFPCIQSIPWFIISEFRLKAEKLINAEGADAFETTGTVGRSPTARGAMESKAERVIG